MNKRILFFAAILFSFLLTQNAFPQISIQAGIGAGITNPSSDLKGATEDFYNGKNYGMSNGYNLHGKVRLGLIGFNIAGMLDYSSLSNDGAAQYDGRGKLEISQKYISLKVGPEFSIGAPLVPVSPYIWPNISYNNVSGKTIVNGTDRTPSGTYEFSSVTRFGAGISGGVVLSFLPFKVDVGVHYNMINLIGKEWKDVNPAKEQRQDTYLSLNDDKDPLYSAGSADHVVSGSRTISTIEFTITAMFGL